MAWASNKPGFTTRIILSLFDPAQPEAPAVLVATVFLLGGTWLFLGILEDVVSNDPLVQFDRGVLSALQGLHGPWADSLMVAATELGSGNVAAPVVISVAVLLAVTRCWRTPAYWIGAVAFAQILVWVIKMVLERVRHPTDLYQGFEQYSFPSGHAASAFVIYGFLAFLIAQGQTRRNKSIIAAVAGAAILLVAISRLYLRVHWVSDVLASLSLGAAWVALLSIAYTHHVRIEPLPARLLALVAVGTLTVAGTFYVSRHHTADLARFAPRDTLVATELANWRGDGWLRLSANRSEIGGDPEVPMTVQWAGPANQVGAAITAQGWQVPPKWTSSAALLWLLPSTAVAELPVLPKFHYGESQQLTFVKSLGQDQRLVIRLWPTGFVVNAGAGKSQLWNGMVTRERTTNPGKLLTVTHTDTDFATPVHGSLNLTVRFICTFKSN